MVERGYGLQLLHYATFRADDTSLPSWIPQWDKAEVLNLPLGINLDGMRVSQVFSATGQSQQALCLSDNDKILIARGIILDTIEGLGSCKHIPKKPEDIKLLDDFTVPMACLAEIIDMLGGTEQYPTKESKLEVVSRLSICDRSLLDRKASKELLAGLEMWVLNEIRSVTAHQLQHVTGGTSYRENANLIIESLELSLSGYIKRRETQIALSYPQALNYAQAFRNAANIQFRRAIRCRTMNGYMCQVPVGSQIGDKIVIIQGCEVPYLLRPSNVDTYSVIGHCYVHGIMYGEAWDKNGAQDIKLS
jgi:hypothetical protein